ncbi:MAG: helix-turn-helix domain-containing protein [Synergistaceae bacterium]|nr:helix-turn-helix domain-containing protein [Synergistaceae bacterium]
MERYKTSNKKFEDKLLHEDEKLSESVVDAENLMPSSNDSVNDNFVQLGQLLVSARDKANITREQIIEKLKIKEEILEAIESGDIETLTAIPRPFLRGFLREYCDLVGAKNLWREYDLKTKTRFKLPKAKLSPLVFDDSQERGLYSVTTASKKNRFFVITFLIVVILLTIYFIYQLRGDIASQFISPAEVVMGLNPLDKVESEDDKNSPKEETTNEGLLEKNEAEGKSTGGAPQPTEKDDVQSTPSDSSQQAKADDSDNTDNVDRKLPTDATSFGWLDKNNKQESEPTIKQPKPPVVDGELNLPPKAKRTITIKAVNVIWIRVTTANRRIFQGLMKKGEVRKFEVESVPVIIRYGKGNKALVTWNGVENLVSNTPKPITVKYTLDAR